MDELILNDGCKIQSKEMEDAINVTKTPVAQDSIRIAKRATDQQLYKNRESMLSISDQAAMLTEYAKNCLKVLLPEDLSKQCSRIARMMSDALHPIAQLYSYDHMANSFNYLERVLENCRLMYFYPDDIPHGEAAENEEANSKIITEIFRSEEEFNQDLHKKDSAIIILYQINDAVLKYLSENPEALYQLSGIDFEIVMAEIYSKSGYDVTRTQLTRDGGKDLIIRKPEVLGDFIYYVECKKFAPNRHIGVGIVRNFVGTVTTDRVNGGIIATTSFFTKDACEFILDNKWDCQIKMNDYNTVRRLLNKVV